MGKNNDVYSGHLCHCQSTTRMPTNWNANRSCQLWNQFLIFCTSFIFPPPPPLFLPAYVVYFSSISDVLISQSYDFYLVFIFFTLSIFTYISYFLAYPILFGGGALSYPVIFWSPDAFKRVNIAKWNFLTFPKYQKQTFWTKFELKFLTLRPFTEIFLSQVEEKSQFCEIFKSQNIIQYFVQR